MCDVVIGEMGWCQGVFVYVDLEFFGFDVVVGGFLQLYMYVVLFGGKCCVLLVKGDVVGQFNWVDDIDDCVQDNLMGMDFC